MTGAQAFVPHYSGANQSDPHDAVYMGYTETNSWHLDAKDVPSLSIGDKIYIYVQAFNVKGTGLTDVDKARDLHDNRVGSDWGVAIVLTKS